MKRNEKRANTNVQPIENGYDYMLTQTFAGGASYKSPVVAFNHYMPDYTAMMAQGTRFKLWCELTPTGGLLHIHGVYSITDKIRYYKHCLPRIKSHGHYLIKKIDNLSKVLDYCSKDEASMNVIIEKCNVKLPLTSRYHLKRDIATAELYERNFFDGWDESDHVSTFPKRDKEKILSAITELPPAAEEPCDNYEHTYCKDYA